MMFWTSGTPSVSAGRATTSLHRLRERWASDAADLVDLVLGDGDVADAVPALAEAFPLRVFPDAVGVRTASTDVPIGDTVIPDGAKILMFLGAANRDPRRWTDPDRFDASRDPSGHVGFGMGIHQCVGQHIARLEAESLLTALASRVTRLELAGPVRRHHNNTLRAWRSIPIHLHRS